MHDDFSNVPSNASCYTLNSQISLYVYRNNVRDTYTQIGGKWFKTATTTYTSVPTNAVCWSYSDLSTLNSNAAFEPIYELIALILALLVWFVIAKIWSNLFRCRV